MKIIASLIIIFLLGTMLTSLFHISTHSDMSNDMTNCPFMINEEVMCSMSLMDHINVWKSIFTATITTLLWSISTSIIIVSVISVTRHLIRYKFKYIIILRRQFRDKLYTFSYRPFQDLFSRGILNPKIF